MRSIFINYAGGGKYQQAQKFGAETAIQAGFDDAILYGPNDIDEEFKEKNKYILSNVKGAGYWLWKPYIIKKTLDLMEDGDLLFYSDSGSYFRKSLQPLVDLLLKEPSMILSFELKGLLEKHYTKRDTFVLMDLDTPEYTESSQREATYIMLIKTRITMHIIEEYLKYAQDARIITDDPNTQYKPNYEGFEGHRHDQSIWSLLMKKYEIPGHLLISQHGNHLRQDFPNDNYSEITFHHRNQK